MPGTAGIDCRRIPAIQRRSQPLPTDPQGRRHHTQTFGHVQLRLLTVRRAFATLNIWKHVTPRLPQDRKEATDRIPALLLMRRAAPEYQLHRRRLF
jgi:hypothetical protein